MIKVIQYIGLITLVSMAWAQEASVRYVWFPSSVPGQDLELEFNGRILRILSQGQVTQTFEGESAREGVFQVFRSGGKVYPVLESTDKKLLALVGFADWPNDYIARRRDRGAWERLMQKDSPLATHGFAIEGGLALSASTTPATPAESIARIFNTPAASWVSPNNPVGAKIEFEVPYGTQRLYIANGFIDPKNLRAWETYGRVRQLEIQSGQNRQVVNLEDNPNFQVINLSAPVSPGAKISLVIRSIYSGRQPAAALNMVIPVYLGRED